MVTRRKTEANFDYMKRDIAMVEEYPINPLKEKKITAGEEAIRKAKFYDYDLIKEWKLKKLKEID